MKYAEELFPLGTFQDQKTPGAYINEYLSQNLDILARRVVDDLHFLGIVSGNDSVGNGKSTMATHIGAYLTWKINKSHKLNLTFTSHNMVFNSEELEERSFELPKYSVIVLDESDDLKDHWAKDSTKHIRRYFRKCRQLNQILIIITPSFFELPKFYSLQRSHFLVNVKFHDDFRRGRFDFYGATKKKLLYLKGKKEWNYSLVKPDFIGAFSSSYVFFPNVKEEIEKYRKMKYEDMLSKEEEVLKPEQVILQLKEKLFLKLYNKLDLTVSELTKIFEIGERTGWDWLRRVREREKLSTSSTSSTRATCDPRENIKISYGKGQKNEKFIPESSKFIPKDEKFIPNSDKFIPKDDDPIINRDSPITNKDNPLQ